MPRLGRKEMVGKVEDHDRKCREDECKDLAVELHLAWQQGHGGEYCAPTEPLDQSDE